MNEKEKILQIAEWEVGYLEKRSNSNLDDPTENAGSNNYTKYARDLDNIGDFYNGPKNGYAWCDVFVDWCFVKAVGVQRALELLCQPKKSAGAGCFYSLTYYKNKGQFYKSNPQRGDQIFFMNTSGDTQHTGLVYAVDSNYVYTIEGNTSNANGVVANGGGVAKKKYSLNYSRIEGYGRPNYNNNVTITTTTTVTQKYTVVKGDTLSGIGAKYGINWKDIATLNGVKGPFYIIHVGQVLTIPSGADIRRGYTGTYPTLPSRGYFINGDRGANVKYLQELLNWITGDKLVVDGIIGPKTLNSVKKAQGIVGAVQDSLFGKETLAKAKNFTK